LQPKAEKRMASAMYRALPILLVVAGCSSEPQRMADTWRSGRDGLCLVGEGGALRAGLIAYGPGNANCSLTGTATRTDDKLVITPRGERACRVEIALNGDTAVIGPRSPACAYYCGPGTDSSGRTLQRSGEPAQKVTDLAGDPLC
jgi:hypothetical protein